MLLGRYTGPVEAGWVGDILLARMETCSQLEIMEYVGHYDHRGINVYSETHAPNWLIVILYLQQTSVRFPKFFSSSLYFSGWISSSYSSFSPRKGGEWQTGFSVNLPFLSERKYWMQSIVQSKSIYRPSSN